MSVNLHTFFDAVKAVFSFDAVLANSTQNGAGVDTLGFRRAAILINGWTGAATTLNWQIQDSPDNSTWTNVAGGTLGSAIAASTADADSYKYNIDLAKRQRYLRVQVIGTGTAGNCSAVVLLYEPNYAGVTQVTNAEVSL